MDRTRGHDAAERADAFEHALHKRRASLGLPVLRGKEEHSEREHVLGAEAGIDALKLDEAAHHEPGAGDEEERNRDLGDDQGAAQAPVSGARGTASDVERLGQFPPADLQAGNQAEAEPASQRDERREGEHGAVDPDLVHARQRKARRKQPQDRAHSPVREHKSQRPAEGGELQALDQELVQEPRAAGAERHPDRHLAGSHRRAHQEQVGDVRASDQEDAAHGAKQNEQRLPDLTHDLLLERNDRRAPLRVHLGALRGGLRRDRFHLGARRLDRNVGPQAGDGLVVAALARRARGVDLDRDEELGAQVRERETRRHDAGDDAQRAVDRDLLADHARVAAVAPLPEPVSQHHARRNAEDVFFRQDRPAQERRHAEDAEEVGRDAQTQELLGLAQRGEVHRDLVERGDRLERAVARAPVEEVLGLDHVRRVAVRRNLPDHDQAVLVVKRQGAEQDRVHHGENCRARADPEREGGHGDERERGTLPEHAPAVARVLRDALDGAPAPDLARDLPDQDRIAEVAARRAACVLGRLPAFDA